MNVLGLVALKKNDIINLTITSVTAQGSGVGRTEDGMVVFVPVTAVGDEIEARILKVKKSYAYAKVERLVKPSEIRVTPDCAAFAKCGGCVYRHIDYNSETEIKYNRVKDAMERIGGFSGLKINPVVQNDRPNRYRNKAQIPVCNTEKGVDFGFYAAHSHRVVPCADCLLQPESFNRAAGIVRDFMNSTAQTAYDEATGRGRLRHIYIRYAEALDELMICLVVNGNGLKYEDMLVESLKNEFPNLKSVIINSNKENTNVILGKNNRTAYGSDYITDALCGRKFKLSPLSFYQVNRSQAEKLYTIAAEYADLQGGETLLDLYCGTGTIGLTMADKCKELIGVEIIPDAVKDAVENAAINNITNARFICSDASRAAESLKAGGTAPDVVIIDPPRKGCDIPLIDTIASLSPEKVVYVSCDPETLARDLRQFANRDYSVEELTPVDLFSRTPHVETVARLEFNA
jgi:23S rRNA (uracil1939-C5)-methyltransferase